MSATLAGNESATATTAPAGSTQGSSTLLKVLAVVTAALGAVFLIVGGTMYGVTSAQLKNQQVTVAPYNEGTNEVPNGAFVGKTVAGPFTALAQIHAIQHHMGQAGAKATGGKLDAATGVVTGGDTGLTYGTTPMMSLAADGTCNMPVNWTDPAGMGTLKCDAKAKPVTTGSVNAAAMAGLRPTLQTGSLLVASLYTSVLAFGVSTLVAGLGVVLLIIGAFQIIAVRNRK